MINSKNVLFRKCIYSHFAIRNKMIFWIIFLLIGGDFKDYFFFNTLQFWKPYNRWHYYHLLLDVCVIKDFASVYIEFLSSPWGGCDASGFKSNL